MFPQFYCTCHIPVLMDSMQYFFFHTIGPTDLLHPSPIPHLKTFKVFLSSLASVIAYFNSLYALILQYYWLIVHFLILRIIKFHVFSTQSVAYINSYIHCILLEKQHKHFCFHVTHEDIRSSLKMAHGCRNM
jgi:hypothetical protein